MESMTAEQQAKYPQVCALIGDKALVATLGVRFPVTILDARLGSGDLEFKIKPINGFGESWVQQNKITTQ